MNLSIESDTVRYSLEKYIESDALLCRGNDGQIYAEFKSMNGKEMVSINSPRFQEWLTHHCFDAGLPPNTSAIRHAIASVKARKWGGTEPVCVRMGFHDGVVYWDLSDQSGRAVEITADGWSLTGDPKLLFPTRPNRRALSEPKKGGSIHLMRDRFGLSAENEALLLSFCLSYLKGYGPCPLLIIVGPENSEKNALARYLHELLDPSTPALRNLPKNEEELAIAARDNYLVAYDDVGGVSPWLENAICKLGRDTTFSKCSRGQEKILFQGARPVILVGDDEVLLNRELASRALIVRLDRRKTFGSSPDAGFEDHAQMQGALLDIVCHGLGRLHDVKISEPVRDYDFEKWIAACDLPRWGLGVFQPAYEANVSDGRLDIVELDPLLITFCEYMAKVQIFRGTFGQLLQELNAAVTIRKGSRWPEGPRALSGRLRRDAKLLPEIELDFDIPKQGRKGDRIMMAKAKFPVEPSGPKHVESLAQQIAELTGSTRKAVAKKRPVADLPLFAEA